MNVLDEDKSRPAGAWFSPAPAKHRYFLQYVRKATGSKQLKLNMLAPLEQPAPEAAGGHAMQDLGRHHEGEAGARTQLTKGGCQ
jgi:hypothetical protein